jgi:hypothetical protein
MDLGAKPMSAAPASGAAAGAGAPWAMAQAAGRMLLLPWNVLAYVATGMVRLADGMRQAAGGGAASMPPAPPAAAGEAGANAWKPPGAGLAGAGPVLQKETKQMNYDKCDTDDCKITLYQYTLVTLRRGRERILDKGQRLVKDPMDDCDFQNLVIGDYVRDHPETSVRWLRVFSDKLHTWEKQPLHYYEKSLDFDQSMAQSLRKIAKKLGAEEAPQDEAIG